MKQVLVIGMGGGFFGVLMRWGLSSLGQSTLRDVNLPYGTLWVNLLGCFFIRLLSALSKLRPFPPKLSDFLLIGLSGEFTTFSTFRNESIHLLRGQPGKPGSLPEACGKRRSGRFGHPGKSFSPVLPRQTPCLICKNAKGAFPSTKFGRRAFRRLADCFQPYVIFLEVRYQSKLNLNRTKKEPIAAVLCAQAGW